MTTPSALRFIASFLVLEALGCSPGAAVPEPSRAPAVESTSEPITDDEAMARTASYLDQRAKAWITERWPFVQGGQCALSCHTTAPYLEIRGRLPGHSSIPTEIRSLVVARVEQGTEVDPWYPDHEKGSRGVEAVLSAAALSTFDEAGSLSPETKKALDALWKFQREDGGFHWWDEFSLVPWESMHSGAWGTAMALYTVARVPTSYREGLTPAQERGLQRLGERVLAIVGDSDLPRNHRALATVAAARQGILPSGSQTALVAELGQAQRDDGSWSALALGFGKGTDCEGHAYATALFGWVLRELGTQPERVARAQQWLRGAREPDGRWEAVSLNDPQRSFNNTLMTDAATAWAVRLLTDEQTVARPR